MTPAAPPPRHRILSIGTLDAHPLWGETSPVRTGHATCVLIESGDARLVVNPGLPPAAIAARLAERRGLAPDAITHVFCTSFRPDHARGLAAFPRATRLLHEPEREAAETRLRERLEQAAEHGDVEGEAPLREALGQLEGFAVADDRVLPGVDLFPLPGRTAGTCGLLLPLPLRTVLVCGDAVATREHVAEGKVLPGCDDVEQAMESFREAIEIADELVLGRDESVASPSRGSL